MKDLQLPPGHVFKMGPVSLLQSSVVSADGSYLDSTIIMKAKNGMQDSWFRNMDDVPSNILFGVSPNGWTDNSKAMRLEEEEKKELVRFQKLKEIELLEAGRAELGESGDDEEEDDREVFYTWC